MKYYIIVYKNTHDAMEADKKFTELGITFRMMPTPTSITQSCGLCTRFEDIQSVENLLNDNSFEFKNVYVKDEEGFNLVR